MLIAVDEKLLENITEALLETHKIINGLKAGNSQLLTEKEAQAYLKRDNDTLLYYRRLGLPYFKKGKDVWYLQADIDAWLATGKVNRRNR